VKVSAVAGFQGRNYRRNRIEIQAAFVTDYALFRPALKLMGNRLSKIYTRTGDDGSTGLGDGRRTAKDSLRVEAYGTVDEANSFVGLALASDDLPEEVRQCLVSVQHDLFELGGELCIPGHAAVKDSFVDRLEAELDRLNAGLPPLKDFVLPGGSPSAAACHVARTVVRRAERRVITLHASEAVRPACIQYLNRLSDLLFVIARTLARRDGGEEVIWDRDRTY
jgi:cob(I)alamin adenosyltransferase